jgi:hypothetical protein
VADAAGSFAVLGADAGDAVFGFVTLLVFPLLGVLALFKRRASPMLWTAVGLWIVAGGLMLLLGRPAQAASAGFVRGWVVGTLLGCGFVAVDWLRTRRRVARWLQLAVALLTLAAFAKAVHDFLERYG